MARTGQKLKLLYLMDILNEFTDEEHGISMAKIISELDKRGITAERKSIYTDINQLRDIDYEVEKYKENGETLYKTISRKFDVSELKFLVDAVQASKFISKKNSEELIKKLEGFTSRYEAIKLQRQVYVSNRVKSDLQTGYYNIDALHDAINSNKQITFEYYEWNIKKELKLRNNGNKTGISPWALTWDDENYYLVAYESATEKIKHYRVDKMKRIQVTDKLRDGRDEFEKFDVAKYSKQVFGMFTGDTKNVRIEFDNSLIGVVIDRFGSDIMIIPQEDDKFTINTDIVISPIFFSWVMSFGEKATILGPDDVVDKMRTMTKNLYEKYYYPLP